MLPERDQVAVNQEAFDEVEEVRERRCEGVAMVIAWKLERRIQLGLFKTVQMLRRLWKPPATLHGYMVGACRKMQVVRAVTSVVSPDFVSGL